MKLPAQLKKLFVTIDGLALRERVLIAAVTMIVLWAVWDTALMRPLEVMGVAREDQLSSLVRQTGELEAAVRGLASERHEMRDPDAGTRARLAEVRELDANLDRHLRELTTDLVGRREMATLLESLLVEAGNLELVGMETLHPEEISESEDIGGYVRQGLALDVRGGYLDALRYLEALERLRWRFFWESVEIDVVAHPESRIRIVVYTLARRPGG